MASSKRASFRSWRDSFRLRISMQSTDSSTGSSNGSPTGSAISVGSHHATTPVDSVPKNHKVVTALYKYETSDKSELSFKKGDKLAIIDDYAPGWWIACKLGTMPQKSGCIPINHVAVDLSGKDWFFPGTSRSDADRLLMEPPAQQGSYLVRKCDIEPDDYILSVRDLDTVKHYSIQSKVNADYFINQDRSFATLDDLLAHYCVTDAIEVNYQKLAKPLHGRPISGQGPFGPNSTLFPRFFLQDETEIKLKKLCIVSEVIWLPSSDFIKVYYGLYRKSGVKHPVAIKELKPGSMSLAAFFAEATMMRSLKHSAIVSLIGVSVSKRPLIITEYLAKGDLLTFLRDNPEAERLTLCELVRMASQVSSAMTYLEHQRIVHRCLMARNCLVGQANQVKVANFGQARRLEPGTDIYLTANRVESFPLKWAAPEAAQQGLFSIKSDVWSFGILLYEIITKGMVPYPGISGSDVLAQLERGHRMPKPSTVNCPESIYGMMNDCWHQAPEKRPEFNFLYCYFDNISLPEVCTEAHENPYEEVTIEETSQE